MAALLDNLTLNKPSRCLCYALLEFERGLPEDLLLSCAQASKNDLTQLEKMQVVKRVECNDKLFYKLNLQKNEQGMIRHLIEQQKVEFISQRALEFSKKITCSIGWIEEAWNTIKYVSN